MNLSIARTTIRSVMEDLGFEEWTDAFNIENIPETLLDKSFHILSPSASGVKLNMHDQVIDFEHHLTIFRRGFQNPAEAEDSIIEDCEDILCSILSPENRLVDKLNIKFEGFTIDPLNIENDNSVKATIILIVQVTLGVT